MGKKARLMSKKHTMEIGERKVVIEGGGDSKGKVVVLGWETGESGNYQVVFWDRVANER